MTLPTNATNKPITLPTNATYRIASFVGTSRTCLDGMNLVTLSKQWFQAVETHRTNTNFYKKRVYNVTMMMELFECAFKEIETHFQSRNRKAPPISLPTTEQCRETAKYIVEKLPQVSRFLPFHYPFPDVPIELARVGNRVFATIATNAFARSDKFAYYMVRMWNSGKDPEPILYTMLYLKMDTNDFSASALKSGILDRDINKARNEIEIAHRLRKDPDVARTYYARERVISDTIREFIQINEFCNGGTLWDALPEILKESSRQGTVEGIRSRAAWLFNACRTLFGLHVEQGIVHRDPIPQNFMLHRPKDSPEPLLKMIDWEFGHQLKDPEKREDIIQETLFRNPADDQDAEYCHANEPPEYTQARTLPTDAAGRTQISMTPAYDIWKLADLMLYLFPEINHSSLKLRDRMSKTARLAIIKQQEEEYQKHPPFPLGDETKATIENLIHSCLHPNPKMRPHIRWVLCELQLIISRLDEQIAAPIAAQKARQLLAKQSLL